MRQKYLFTTIKVLSLLAFFLCAFPVICTYSLILKESSKLCFIQQIICTICGFIGYGINLFLQHRLKRPIAANIISYFISSILSLIIALLGFFALHFHIATAILFGFTVGIISFLGARITNDDYDEIYSIRPFIFTVGTMFLSLIIFQFIAVEHANPPYLIVFLFATAVYALSRNQGNLDFLMKRRQHDLSHLPPKIRYYNLLMLIILFVIILVLFLFKSQIMAFFTLAWKGILVFISFIFYLLSKLGSSTSSEDISGGGSPPAFGDAPAQTNQSWDIIMYIVIGAIIVFLIHQYGKPILQALLTKLRVLFAKIKAFLQKSKLLAGRIDKASEYYKDEEFTLQGEDLVSLSDISSNKTAYRKWKRSLRLYLKQSDETKNFRHGYALVVEGIKLKNIPILQSDTPLEIAQKLTLRTPNVDIHTATVCYDAIRYGDKPIKPNINSIVTVLKQIEQLQ